MGILFLHLGSEVAEGETQAFDAYVANAGLMLRTAHPWIADVMRDLSGLGSVVVLALVTAAACGFLSITRSRATAVVVATAVTTGAIAMLLFKELFGRARPDGTLAQILVDGPSFPSGHASMSAVVFLTLGVLVMRLQSRRRERAYVLGLAVVLTVLVGASRAAMGVHWATDVVGGWALGIGWATASVLVLHALGR
jgi:undecaprenyl-diphosphatase